MPWSLLHLERTLFAFQHIPSAYEGLITNSAAVLQWFLHYATGRAEPKSPAKAAALAAAAAAAAAASGYSSNIAKNLFDARQQQLQQQQGLRRLDDVVAMGLTYKALSRFAHDFGLIPFLLKEPHLFG